MKTGKNNHQVIKVFRKLSPWLYKGKIETDTGGKCKPTNASLTVFALFFLMLFDFKLASPCLDEHMLLHNYSPLKISTVLQTSRRKEFSGRRWATRHEMPDPFNCSKWLAISFPCIFLPPHTHPPPCHYDCCFCFARTCHFTYTLSPPS